MRQVFATGIMCVALSGLIVGCAPTDRPQEYGQRRPPVDQLDPRDRGLQSKDVVAASDQMAMALLASPRLNRDKNSWTMVVMPVENRSSNPRMNYDIFIERLRVNLARHGSDRVQLIENRDRFRDMQSRELEQERDDFGQGGGRSQPGPAGIQPDYALYGKVMDLPNSGTNYYLFQFTITKFGTREQVWSDAYEVRVEW